MKPGMKRTDLKRVLKPIVKELIQESLEEILLEDDYINEHINNMILNSDMLKSITEQVAGGMSRSYLKLINEQTDTRQYKSTHQPQRKATPKSFEDFPEEFEGKIGEDIVSENVRRKLAKDTGLDVFRDVDSNDGYGNQIPLEILLSENYAAPVSSNESDVKSGMNLVKSADPNNSGGIPLSTIAALTGGKTKFKY